jgi:hypothetical protein
MTGMAFEWVGATMALASVVRKLNIACSPLDGRALMRVTRAPEDTLFPKTKVAQGADFEFGAAGVDRMPWANANPVRNAFRDASKLAGLPYFNPHSFRNTLAQLAYEWKLDPEAFKAWSQNLGHESMLTTLCSYGQIPPNRQGEIMRGLGRRNIDPEAIRWMASFMKRNGTDG